MRFKYTKAHINFISKEFKRVKVAKVTELFNAKFSLNKTPAQIKSLISNRGMTCGRGVGKAKGDYKILTTDQVEFVKVTYKKYDLKVTTEKLNRKFDLQLHWQQIKSFVKNHGITCGRSGHFEKGLVPHNKGTKGLMKPNEGSFKKGCTPVNILPVGSERINTGGYTEIKISEPNVWQLKQRYIWGQTYGTDNLPENIRFLDDNRQNCDPSNLLAVDNKVNLVLNRTGFNQLPSEIKPVAVNVAKLQVKVNTIQKEQKQCQA
jgi:hypothetical protein